MNSTNGEANLKEAKTAPTVSLLGWQWGSVKVIVEVEKAPVYVTDGNKLLLQRMIRSIAMVDYDQQNFKIRHCRSWN